jgi:GAF domain-containing protein
MDSRAALTGLARLSGLLVHEHDALSVVTTGLVEACATVSADAGGVLVSSPSGQLEVLAATSHRVADLEAYQTGAEQGPCVESISKGRQITVGSPAEAESAWPGFGVRMEAAGYARVHAVPMLWQGTGIGGLNLFWRDGGTLGESESEMLQTYADMLTIALVHIRQVPVADALERLRASLDSRSGIEQAKGVLAYQHDIDMEAAYDALVALAEARGTTIADAVTAVMDGARRGQAI